MIKTFKADGDVVATFVYDDSFTGGITIIKDGEKIVLDAKQVIQFLSECVIEGSGSESVKAQLRAADCKVLLRQLGQALDALGAHHRQCTWDGYKPGHPMHTATCAALSLTEVPGSPCDDCQGSLNGCDYCKTHYFPIEPAVAPLVKQTPPDTDADI